MGYLILKSNDSREASWFAPVHHMSGGWRVEWEKTFPITVMMHLDVLSEANTSRRWEIRRWIERHLPGPVLYSYKEMDYSYYYGTDPNMYVSFERTYTRRHGYHLFHFEELADATLFKLRFSDWVSPAMVAEHPSYPESEGYLRFDPRRNI